ncbi:hypothetical protein HK104_003458 [Borealophlyctis nickersoniae]|nr:hypothetical protein HK104_003458 [Borealophlyctis nickersoniae]
MNPASLPVASLPVASLPVASLPVASLPVELFSNIVRYCHPIDGRNVRRMNRKLSYSTSPQDLMWGEAGWRRRCRGAEDCFLWAALNGHSEVILKLLDTEAVASIAGPFGDNPNIALRVAAQGRHVEVVRLLLSDQVNVPWFRVVLDVDKRCRPSIHRNWYQALPRAAAGGHPEIVLLLLEKGVDVNAGDDWGFPLGFAAERGHLEVAGLLLDAGADVHAFGEEALCLAARNGRLEMVRLLLDSGANVPDRVLLDAETRAHVEVVRLLEERLGSQ